MVDSRGDLGQALQGRRLPLRPDGPPHEVQHAQAARRARRAHRWRRTAWTARRSTSTARAGTSARWPTTRAACNATQAQHGRHGHRHLQRPPPRRGARRRPVQRPPGAGLPHRPLLRPERHQPGHGRRPAAARCSQDDRLDPRRAWPATSRTTRSSDRSGNTVTGAADRLQRPARRLHRRSAGGHQLRRGPRQRDAVRRHPAEGRRATRRHGRPGAHAEPGHRASSALGQGIPFFHAGDELLRSKSLDRNSYNSGDWFNKLDFTYQSNNWGVGLPPARRQPEQLADHAAAAGEPGAQAGAGRTSWRACAHFLEMLAHPQELAAVPAAHGRGRQAAADASTTPARTRSPASS